MPLMSELTDLFWKAYEGRGVPQGVATTVPAPEEQTA
jgi:hypothetical protein